MEEAIRFFCGVNETIWNHHPVTPGAYACVAPVFGNTRKVVNHVSIPLETLVLQDSGAFSDKPEERLSFAEALERQIAHAERYGYASQVMARASYDCLLIDEIWERGIRRKGRWSREAGWMAVEKSVEAAVYLRKHHGTIPAVLSAQGVTTEQYLTCAEQIVPLLSEGDIFGMGGWCIIGRNPHKMMPLFRCTLHKLIPFLGREGVKRLHIWGVCFPDALGELLYACDEYGIEVSTDNSGASTHPVFGEWGYGNWRDNAYTVPNVLRSCRQLDESGKKAPTCTPTTRCRGQERIRHVALTRSYFAHFREREAARYHFVSSAEQLSWLDELKQNHHDGIEEGAA